MTLPLYNFSEKLFRVFAQNDSWWNEPLLDNLDQESINSLVYNHRYLANFYKYLRQMIAAEESYTQSLEASQEADSTFHKKQDKKTRALRIKQYKAALFLAELLEHIYLSHWRNDRFIAKLRAEQDVLRTKLNTLGFKIITPIRIFVPVPPWSLSAFILDQHPDATAKRLILARLNRMMTVLHQISKILQGYKDFIKLVSPYIGFLFTHLAWIAFIPRMGSHLWTFIIRLVPGEWMHENEKKLGWRVRLMILLKECWPALINDLLWFSNGLLGAFVLTGALSVVAIYLTVTIFWIDILIQGIKAAFNLVDLYALRDQFTSTIITDKVQKQAMQSFIAALDAQIAYEKKRTILAVGNSVALFLAMSLTLPAIVAMAPLVIAPLHILLVSAILVLAISVFVYATGRILENWFAPPEEYIPAPPETESKLGKLGFFARSCLSKLKQAEPEEDCKDDAVSLPFLALQK